MTALEHSRRLEHAPHCSSPPGPDIRERSARARRPFPRSECAWSRRRCSASTAVRSRVLVTSLELASTWQRFARGCTRSRSLVPRGDIRGPGVCTAELFLRHSKAAVVWRAFGRHRERVRQCSRPSEPATFSRVAPFCVRMPEPGFACCAAARCARAVVSSVAAPSRLRRRSRARRSAAIDHATAAAATAPRIASAMSDMDTRTKFRRKDRAAQSGEARLMIESPHMNPRELTLRERHATPCPSAAKSARRARRLRATACCASRGRLGRPRRFTSRRRLGTLGPSTRVVLHNLQRQSATAGRRGKIKARFRPGPIER